MPRVLGVNVDLVIGLAKAPWHLFQAAQQFFFYHKPIVKTPAQLNTASTAGGFYNDFAHPTPSSPQTDLICLLPKLP